MERACRSLKSELYCCATTVQGKLLRARRRPAAPIYSRITDYAKELVRPNGLLALWERA